MNESPDLRPALAYLKALASNDYDGIRVLTEHGDVLELVDGLADLVLLFVCDFTDNPAGHIDVMFRALAAAESENE